MNKPFTNVWAVEPFSIGDSATAVRFDYFRLENFISPIVLFDHVRVKKASFPPHGHAGFCVFSYIFEDSPGALRDRDSLNSEVVVNPGDVLWFQMGTGLIHEENPVEEGREVHQFQVFVPISQANRMAEPKTFHVKAEDIPEFTDGEENRVRTVLGEYAGMVSPLPTLEPFTLLDIFLESGMNFEVKKGWSALIYVMSGQIKVAADGNEVPLRPGETIGVRAGSTVALAASEKSRVLILSRPILDEPIVLQGMFLMSRQADIDAAKRRFHEGKFGDVVPYGKLMHPGKLYVPAGQDPNVTAMATVEKRATVRHYDEGWWKLHLDWCRFDYSDGEWAYGYRFIWEDPDGRETPYRYQGYIPYMEYINELLTIASCEGWGNLPYRDSF